MQIDDLAKLSSHQDKGLTNAASRSRIALIVPKRLVKKIKDALEAHGLLDKSVKIRPARFEEEIPCSDGALVEISPNYFYIPTKNVVGVEQGDSKTILVKRDLLKSLGLVGCENDVGIIFSKQAHDAHGSEDADGGSREGSSSHEAFASETSSLNPLARAIDHWLHRLPLENPEPPFAKDVVLSHRWTYMIYPPLLLLPPTALSNLSSIFASKGHSLPKDLSFLWSLISRDSQTSHIALNAPILASASEGNSVQGGEHLEANILRSPTGFAPLYGDFGPALPLDRIPATTDFSSAFWCSAQQNGIFQTWAPRYTMFSRGNISEKARILRLKTLTRKQLGCQPEETSAVDLYAGVGYFAFSYAKARVGKVLCFEINPWSVEGLRRGAKRNKWAVEVIKDGQALDKTTHGEKRFIVFQESNEHAARRIAAIKDSIPPVRHVNCGLLPSSKDSWEIAVQVLDPAGGWIHVHENVAKKDIEDKTKEVVGIFNRLVMKHYVHEPEKQRRFECDHVEQIKSYAPGVMHYVLDISVSPSG